MESKASCNCGAVTLTLQYTDAAELRSILCHCVNCAKSSGSVGSNYIIVPRTAVSVEGDLTTYVDLKCESGLPLQRKFCGACGSPVMAYSAKLGDALCIIRATMVSIPVKPAAHAYLRNAPEWMPRVEGTAGFKGAFGGETM
ncbi:Mss4-like protein [Aspergillus insuetus]